jgi:hypothetical protein
VPAERVLDAAHRRQAIAQQPLGRAHDGVLAAGVPEPADGAGALEHRRVPLRGLVERQPTELQRDRGELVAGGAHQAVGLALELARLVRPAPRRPG